MDIPSDLSQQTVVHFVKVTRGYMAVSGKQQYQHIHFSCPDGEPASVRGQGKQVHVATVFRNGRVKSINIEVKMVAGQAQVPCRCFI